MDWPAWIHACGLVEAAQHFVFSQGFVGAARNALLAGESLKVALPLTSLVQQMLISLMNEGKGDLDHSAIVNFIEDMAGIEIKP